MKTNNSIEKIVHIGNNYYACNLELPKKGDEIIVEQLDSSLIVSKAHKDLLLSDCHVESCRMVWKICNTITC